MTRIWSASLAVIGAALFTSASVELSAQQNIEAVPIGHAADFGGVVTSANGPEAGVWVIAETTELPTKFAKIESPTIKGDT